MAINRKSLYKVVLLSTITFNLLVSAKASTDLNTIRNATYNSIKAMVEPSTGLPHDKFDAALFDTIPQLASIRSIPRTYKADGASLTDEEYVQCTDAECRYSGNYGLKFEYDMSLPDTWGSYNIEGSFDISKASYLEAWVKGAKGTEQFGFVLWSDCQGSFPGRPINFSSISVSQTWQQVRIPLVNFPDTVNLSSICRLAIDFNNGMHPTEVSPSGTIYIDSITFIDDFNRVHIPLDEETNVTNIGFYIASVLGALEVGLESYNNVVANLTKTITSIESLQKWHGFPQTHNRVVSLQPTNGDTCISAVDTGFFAAGLILLKQRIPELANRANTLLNAMEWDWLYDSNAGFFYVCRYSDDKVSEEYYDWLTADSRIAYFIAIGMGKIPASSWNNLNREKESPRCTTRISRHFGPGWEGGGLFMALQPAIFLNEVETELETLSSNFIDDQRCRYQEVDAPAWGFSATALPPSYLYYGDKGEKSYCGYGCESGSIVDNLEDIIVPHASILAVDYIGDTVFIENLNNLEALGARAPVTDGEQILDFGFRASIDWVKNEVATVYLILDQSMAFLSLVNHQTGGRTPSLFCKDEITQSATNSIPNYINSCTINCIMDNTSLVPSVTFTVNGNIVTSNYKFNTNENIDLLANIQVRSHDISKNANIYIVALYQGSFYIKDSNGNWLPWNGNIGNLVINYERILQSTENISIVNGLTGIEGKFEIFIGYKTQEICNPVYNHSPIILKVGRI